MRFYQVIPLYEEEMDFKVKHGADALLDRFGKEAPDLVDIHRKNVCAPPPKPYAIPMEKIKPLISSQEGCIVSDRIMVDGCKVGFCYREEPMPDPSRTAAGGSSPGTKPRSIWTIRATPTCTG